MSSENEESESSLQSLVGSSAPDSDQKKPRIKYSREFFLSLSGLDVCKKIPSGLDKSILSDLEEAASTVFDRQRGLGNLSLQGPRRGEYGSQSLNRLENSNNYTRGSSTRWDTRSSGSSDREGDLHSDRDSFIQDPGKRSGNQNRRGWQHQEHDGLLGSGALARPSGYTGTSASKARGNGQYQLSRSTEPYQPPRPYKAVPYSRKDGTDSCNDETFGSSECSDKDRVEEERKRRESFELMRKEQQKTLQEVQHKDIIKGNFDFDIMTLSDNSNADNSTKSRCKPDESATDSLSLGDFSKSSSLVHVTTARPLVPPGFASSLTEKNHPLQMNILKNPNLESNDEKENPSAPSSVDIIFGNISFSTSGLQEVNEVWKEDMSNDSFHKKVAGSDRVDTITRVQSTSIFDKLFENAGLNNPESLASDTQIHASEADEESWSHVAPASSKFSHLFHEESQGQPHEKMPIKDKSSRDLLSLIVNNDNLTSQDYKPSNDEATEQNKLRLPPENNAIFNSAAPSPIAGSLESFQSDQQSPSCAVLTCEDLEQSILAEVKDKCSVMQSLKESWTAFVAKSEEQSDVVDDHASQHLLSLLQRGANSKESMESSRLDAIGCHEMLPSSDIRSSLRLQISDNAALSLSETENTTGKCPTLEALFGSAFMNELHSMEEPVSVQKISVGRVTNGGANHLPFNSFDSLTSSFNDQHPNKNVFDGEMLQLSNTTEFTKAQKNAGNWTALRDSSLHGFKLSDATFEQAAGTIHLPEEDSLISLSDSLDTVTPDSLHFQKTNINESLGPKKTVGDLSDKLHSILRVGEFSREPAVDYPTLMHASHEMADPDSHYHHLQIRAPSQFPHQMNQVRPMFAPHFDHSTFRNSPMSFGSPNAMHHDPLHPFSSNAFAYNSYKNFSGQHLDSAARHPMLQTMKRPGNFPSHNTVHGLPQVPLSQPIIHVPDFSHELSHLHAFPLHHQQANFGGHGMGMPGPVGGSGRPPPEIYERLIEMEMRANSKFRPSIPEHVSGMYGTEFDMNLRYR